MGLWPPWQKILHNKEQVEQSPPTKNSAWAINRPKNDVDYYAKKVQNKNNMWTGIRF